MGKRRKRFPVVIAQAQKWDRGREGDQRVSLALAGAGPGLLDCWVHIDGPRPR